MKFAGPLKFNVAFPGGHHIPTPPDWVVALRPPQYQDIASDAVANAAPGIVILDANRFLSSFASNARVRYVAVGTPE